MPSEITPHSRSRETDGGDSSRTVFSLSEDETLELGRTVARKLKGGELILLEGDLGLGKTVFARGVAIGLGLAPEDVSSPSFTLIQEYRGGRLTMFHVDLYRLASDEEIATLGLEEIQTDRAVVLVEWGEKIPPRYRRDAIVVRLHDVGEDSRRIEISGLERDRPTERRGDA
ncbi:MAG TPA: tRNA (adenosine(37)-N6)-threonylcarbamoyltransferase complex ATPase subunit type 1 TsaE [Candidatus Polarisedimenticolaceae bacterium]|nr:tRNA (adenosine(37)-N6)-threonylcarbamoyltransferase complex ATPase subunit type 1 TsaE [Candidatus Polarisedimenticolaceae bacterium]